MPTWFFVAGSTLFASMGLLQNWLLGQKMRSGWVVLVACVTLTVPYDWLTHQYGYIVPSLLMVGIGVRSYRKWATGGNDGGSNAEH